MSETPPIQKQGLPPSLTQSQHSAGSKPSIGHEQRQEDNRIENYSEVRQNFQKVQHDGGMIIQNESNTYVESFERNQVGPEAREVHGYTNVGASGTFEGKMESRQFQREQFSNFETFREGVQSSSNKKEEVLYNQSQSQKDSIQKVQSFRPGEIAQASLTESQTQKSLPPRPQNSIPGGQASASLRESQFQTETIARGQNSLTAGATSTGFQQEWVPSILQPHQASIAQSNRTIGQSPVPSLTSSQVVQQGGHVISQRVGEARLVSERVGQGYVKEWRNLDERITKQTVTKGESKVVGETELEKKRVSKATPSGSRHDQQVERIKREKIVEIRREKPVPVENIVDVEYEVILDIPIERTIEKEKIIEVKIEKEIEKIVEIPVEQVVEIEVEKIIEVPVEVVREVDAPYETIVEKPFEVIKENIKYKPKYVDVDEKDLGLYPELEKSQTVVDYRNEQVIVEKPKYIENLIETVVHVPKEKICEVSTEKIVPVKKVFTVDRMVPVEKVIEKIVEVPTEVPVYKYAEKKVSVPVVRENIIEKKVPFEKIVEKEVEVPIDRPVMRQLLIENLIERPVYNIVEVPVIEEEVVNIPREMVVGTKYLEISEIRKTQNDRVVTQSIANVKKVNVPLEQNVDRMKPVPVEVPIERRINRYKEKPVERIVERPVFIERIIERPREVELIKEVQVEVIKEVVKTVEKIVENPVHYDAVIEQEVEVIVEKEVKVPVEKIIEVPVEIKVAKPRIVEKVVNDYFEVEVEKVNFEEETLPEEVNEVEDEELNFKIRQLRDEEVRQTQSNQALRNQLQTVLSKVEVLRKNAVSEEQKMNLQLLSRMMTLLSQVRNAEEENKLLMEGVKAGSIKEVVVREDPRAKELISTLEQKIVENKTLVSNVVSKDQKVKNLLGSLTNQ